MNIKKNQGGFTLLEILIAMVLLTVISVVLVGSLAPWLNFKQKLDTERKMLDLKTAFGLAYEANAMSIDSVADSKLVLATGVVTNSPGNGGQCVADDNSWQALASFLPEGPQASQKDGYGSPFCVLVSPQYSAPVNGVTIYYHNIALVSMGRDGNLAPDTGFDPATGALNLGGDNMGVLVSGYSVQKAKLEQTQARMDKLGSLYETYFTTQYLANPSRDITVDYFAVDNPDGTWDTGGSGVPGTGNMGPYAKAVDVLRPLGVGPVETTSAYEASNSIMVANYNENIVGTVVKSSSNGGTPPYTALLYTAIPGPAGTFLIKTVTGNY